MNSRALVALLVVYISASISFGQATGEDIAKEYFRRAIDSVGQRKWNDALSEIETAIRFHYPDHGQALHIRARAKLGLNDFNGSFADATAAIPLLEYPTAAYMTRGDVRAIQNDWVGAIAEYTKAIELGPNELEAYRRRAAVYENKGDLDAALADRNQVIKIYAAMDDYFARGWLLLKKGDRQAAFADFNKMARSYPGIPHAYIQRGNAYLSIKDYEKAETDAKTALSLRKDDASVHHLFGHINLAKADVRSAGDWFTKAIAADPQNVHYYIDRAKTLNSGGDHISALKDLDAAISKDATKPDYYRLRAWTRLYAGLNSQAYVDSTKALELGGLKDNGAFAVLTGYIAARKSGKTATAALAFLNPWLRKARKGEWATQIMQYLAGQLTSAQLIAAAGTDQGKLTEAYTFAGEMALLKKEVATARQNFEWVQANGSRAYLEFPFAIAELKRL